MSHFLIWNMATNEVTTQAPDLATAQKHFEWWGPRADHVVITEVDDTITIDNYRDAYAALLMGIKRRSL